MKALVGLGKLPDPACRPSEVNLLYSKPGMARGNQRDKAREKNQKEAAGQKKKNIVRPNSIL